jgi:hypothetical protein
MSELAFQTDELGLSDADKACCVHEYRMFGPQSADTLIQGLRRHGYKVDGYLESARLCPLEDYLRVEEVYKALPEQPRPKIRRSK